MKEQQIILQFNINLLQDNNTKVTESFSFY